MSAGREVVFADLHARYRTRMYGLAYHLTCNRDDAEDLVQETFARAWRSFDGLREHASFFPWLRAILVNAWRDRLAARAKEPLVRRAAEEQAKPALDDPASAAARREERALVRALVFSLEERERVVLDLVHLQGHSSEEASRLLGLEAGNVRVILHRARRKLALLLSKHGKK